MSGKIGTDSDSDSNSTPVLSKAEIVGRLKAQDVAGRLKAEAAVVEYARRKRHASVLVPLILRENGVLEVLLTVRAKHMRSHGGEVAFPGGKQDEGDADATATALREAWEEIGLRQADVEVVSQLPPLVSRESYFITPITAIIPKDFQPNMNLDEVEDVFRVPLIDFLKHDHYESRQMSTTGRFSILHFFRHTIDGKMYVTYGLTAYLCILAACSVYKRVPDFAMEPGFDRTNFLQGLIDFVEGEMSDQKLTQSSSKL